MSWIEKELRRRKKMDARSTQADAQGPASAGETNVQERIRSLWMRFESANAQLPAELQLRRQSGDEFKVQLDLRIFQIILRAANGAGLGFTGDAIKYFWPEKNARKSNNLWIRPRPDGTFQIFRRRQQVSLQATGDEATFDEKSIDRIVKCLVTDRRVTWRSARKRSLWLF